MCDLDCIWSRVRSHPIIRFSFMISVLIIYISTCSIISDQKPYIIFSQKRLNTSYLCTVCRSEEFHQGRSYDNEDVDILDCFFSRISYFTGNGGVIFISGEGFSMNVSHSMFYKCTCTNTGGAIYFFNSTNSSLRMICSNECSALSYDHFAYLHPCIFNKVEFLSVSSCSPVSTGYYCVHLRDGYQKIQNMNSSLNKAKWVSGVYISSPFTFASSFCTFSNNNASEYICIRFYSCAGEMSFTNIVHNNSPSLGVVLVFGSASTKLNHCIINSNQNTLFYVESGSLEVSNSEIYHSGQFSSSINVVTSSNNTIDPIYPPERRRTIQIIHFNSHFCNADNPIIDPKYTSHSRTSYIHYFGLVMTLVK